jgi:transcriptional regulator with XRE-family HTH domain
MKTAKLNRNTEGFAGLKRIMRESGLTVLDVAKLSGRCSQSSMSRYLRGKRDMEFHTALALARALHVKAEELSGGKEQEALDELQAAQARLAKIQGITNTDSNFTIESGSAAIKANADIEGFVDSLFADKTCVVMWPAASAPVTRSQMCAFLHSVQSRELPSGSRSSVAKRSGSTKQTTATTRHPSDSRKARNVMPPAVSSAS